MRVARLLTSFACAGIFGAVLYAQGCGGGNGGPDSVVFHGNVENVVPPAGAARQTESDRRLARRSTRFELVSSAVAQSAQCSETTQQNLSDVFLCIVTATSTSCSHVDAGTCDFTAEIRLQADHDPLFLVFTNDPDGNGDNALLTGYESNAFCNGDVVRIPDVTIDFPGETATPGGPIVKEASACGAAPPTSTRGPTRTPTRPGTSATETPTPHGPSPTPTPEGGSLPTETPTPPTVPTPTPTVVACKSFPAMCAANAECCNNLCVFAICVP